MNTQNMLISWNTRGQGEANTEVVFSLVNSPVNNLTFPQWLLEQATTNPKVLTAISDAFILSLKPACQRIAKDSLGRVMTADFNLVIDSLVNGTPARSKYLEESEALALAEILMQYWSGKPSLLETAKALLVGALTNKAPKGVNVGVLLKVRESWSARLIDNGVEVPPALIPAAVVAIDAAAF